MNIVILALPVLSTLLAGMRLAQQQLERGTLHTHYLALALPARIRPSRVRDAEADADVADAAALSSYRPGPPKTDVSLFALVP
jgi:hypothetical protein